MPLNARTWHRLHSSFLLFLPALTIFIWLPEDSPWRDVAWTLIAWVVLVLIWGVVSGIRTLRGKTRLGCPLCKRPSQVDDMDKNGIYFTCPNCGELRMDTHNPFRQRVVRVGAEEDELAHCQPAATNGFKHAATYPKSFLLIYIPVIITTIIGSSLHGFHFFYLLIPGIFCFGLASVLVENFHTGRVTDNSGTAVRQATPVRYWSRMTIWTLIYLFGMCAPLFPRPQ